ncbi:unnamed protein product [Polarella glacialis]|uniref:Uncharacterized protein n=2 Tax=Polarella glacialis TaxID=89957 RepID=A0A813KWS3_POLGL|nr:unnamed protein product [Polarella glacialis]CAE8715156.1 unnamed protein product [Polarella glacialis]
MGGVQSTAQDVLVALSPWSTQIYVKNCTATPVAVLLARDPKQPSHVDAAVYEVPANETCVISSGYLHEPRATLLIRTGIEEAKIFRVPNFGRLLISVSQHGLKVETTDHVEISDYAEPHVVPGHDTIPMVLRRESFESKESDPRLLGQGGAPEQKEEKLAQAQELTGAEAEDHSLHERRPGKSPRLAAPDGLEQ